MHKKFIYKIFFSRSYFIISVLYCFFILSNNLSCSLDKDLVHNLNMQENEWDTKKLSHALEQLFAVMQTGEKAQEEKISESVMPAGWLTKNYLDRYYPKAYVICHNYAQYATSQELINIITDVIDLLTNNPLFYFVNKDEQHAPEAHYWEYIIDQIALIYRFLKECMVNENGFVVHEEKNDDEFFYKDFSLDSLSEYKTYRRPLLTALTTRQMETIYKLLALSYDYNNKMFNEAILFFDLVQAQRYLQELTFLTTKLQNSHYGIDYQEALATSKELYALLQQELNVDFSLSLGVTT